MSCAPPNCVCQSSYEESGARASWCILVRRESAAHERGDAERGEKRRACPQRRYLVGAIAKREQNPSARPDADARERGLHS